MMGKINRVAWAFCWLRQRDPFSVASNFTDVQFEIHFARHTMRRTLIGLLGSMLLFAFVANARAARSGQLDTASKQAATKAKQAGSGSGQGSSGGAGPSGPAAAPAPTNSILKPYSSVGGRFSVLMPGTPTTSSQPVAVNPNDSTQTMPLYSFSAATDSDNVAYMVFYNDYPPGVATDEPSAVLGRARDGIANGKTLISDTAIDMNGIPGRAFLVRGPDGFSYDVRQYFTARRLYQVMIVTTQGYTAKYRDPFMNSFIIGDQTLKSGGVAMATPAPAAAPAVRAETGPVAATPATPVATSSDLKPFSSAAGRFNILMPGTPEAGVNPEPLTDDPQGRSINMYSFTLSVQNDNVAYLVSYNDYPPDVANDAPDAVMQRVRDGASSGKTLLTDTAIQQRGVAGRAFTYRDSDGNNFDEREFFVNHRLYQLLVVTAPNYTANDRDAFLNSFTITGN
jgi:hypothetical protein